MTSTIAPLLVDRRAMGLGLFAALQAPVIAHAATPSAEALMTASYKAGRFNSAKFQAQLQLTGQGAPRLRELTGASRLLENGAAMARLMKINAPSDMRGVGTLTVERPAASDDLWVYLPSLRRIRRLVSSNRRDPWLGSDFSLGDIVGHDVADWRHVTLRRETVAGAPCTVVESLPNRQGLAAETGYSRRLTWVRDSDAVAAKATFYDLSGGLLKTMDASDVRLLDAKEGKSQAMRITMRNERAKTVSVLNFRDFKINAPVAASEVAPGALTS
ncbi:outer membrane lipoprotein-sorting protein [Caulobacter sp. NIBR2454]|uniref:outer membrane lipoprotein-sorting protein n=1 Tax=Caulobacter sp. NIBR2454 TaxID=3015996 RepID=UPI0022B6AEC6|nr:outer membrane lipoprotein-sorting protein [Caulobacter sp. NIBR2454]